MVGTKIFVCNIIFCLITSSKMLIRAEKRLNNLRASLNETQSLNIYPGIKFFLANDEIIVHVRIRDLLQETEMQSRKKEEKKNPLQRFGFMVMMAPFVMQILSLPGAIATIKMSLLKSIMVAQLAIAIMIYNLLKSVQDSEVVVVHQQQHHAHYYHGYHNHGENEDEWFGR